MTHMDVCHASIAITVHIKIFPNVPFWFTRSQAPDDPECAKRAVEGDCTRNPAFMMRSCRQACGRCGNASTSFLGNTYNTLKFMPSSFSYCKDKSSFCGEWAAVGECSSNPRYMLANCPLTCHLCQSAACHDKNTTQCEKEALQGRCNTDPELMYRECRWSCKWCAMTTSSWCRRDQASKPALVPNQMKSVFEWAISHSQ